MFRYVLKGAVIDHAQLSDRVRSMQDAGLTLALELHTMGARDIGSAGTRSTAIANVRRLVGEHGRVDLTVHVPVQVVPSITVIDFDSDQVEDAIAFAQDVGAPRIVIHRYWGMVYGQARQRCDRATATAAFNETVKGLARLAGPTSILVENVGHYSILPRDAASFIAGPLDHFFPWEIEAFRSYLVEEKIANVEPFVDVAHATLSANLFNWRRAHVAATRDDARYTGVLDIDLQRATRLHPFDFVDGAMTWLHLSDSIFYDDPRRQPAEIPLAALISEGLEIGAGNLPWATLGSRLDPARDPGLVLEVDPAENETQRANGAQARSLHRLRAILEGHSPDTLDQRLIPSAGSPDAPSA